MTACDSPLAAASAASINTPGVRVSELCAMRIGHLRLHDPEGARLHIPDAKTETGVRVIEVSPYLAEVLITHIDRLRLEIGVGFRMPDVITQSGARLIEVGTTNRTHLTDYQHGIQQGADLILAVHPSNFQTLGYTAAVPIETLCTLGLPVIHDGRVLSGDKLLGRPQAGILAGTHQAVEVCRKHPLTRAIRIGRLPLAALEATLRLYRDPERALQEIPVLLMLAIDPIRLQHRAKTLAQKTGGEPIEATARVGGGALPLLDLTGPVVALPYHGNPTLLAQALREAYPPLLTRVNNDRVLVNPRTLPDNALSAAANVIRHTLSSLIGQRTEYVSGFPAA